MSEHTTGQKVLQVQRREAETHPVSNRTASEPGRTIQISWSQFELATGLLLSIFVLFRQFEYQSVLGGLWRDEAHSVAMAQYPRLFVTWYNDSFPVLWQILLRTWITCFGSSDFALRCYGLASGAVLVGAIWRVGRQFGVLVPWCLLTFLALNEQMLFQTVTVRGYGLAITLQVLLVGAVWTFVQRPSAANGLMCQLLLLCSVHTSYGNAFFVLGACIAGGLAFLCDRRWNPLLALAGMGVVTALSMIPYALVVFPEFNEWAMITKVRLPVRQLAETVFTHTFVRRSVALGVVWLICLAVSMELAAIDALKGTPDASGCSRRARGVFLLAFTIVSVPAFFWYLTFLKVNVAPRYSLPLIAGFAMIAELGLANRARIDEMRKSVRFLHFAKIALMLGLVCIQYSSAPAASRITNIDMAAKAVAQSAQPQDLVVLSHWYLYVSFDRYYQGRGNRMSFPDVGLDPSRLIGYGELKRDYLTKDVPDSLSREFARIKDTLRQGGKVWIVGDLPAIPPNEKPFTVKANATPQMYPVPKGATPRSQFDIFERSWLSHLTALLQKNAVRETNIPLPSETPVQIDEMVTVKVFEGWKPD